jgi:hypothetical protein
MAELYGALQQQPPPQQQQPKKPAQPGQDLYGALGGTQGAPDAPAQSPYRVQGDPLQASPQPSGGQPQQPSPQSAPTGGGAGMDPGQAAAAGLGWVPPDHPLYGTPGFVGSTPGMGSGAPSDVMPQPGATPTPTTPQPTAPPSIALGNTTDAPTGQPQGGQPAPQPQSPQQQMQAQLRTSIMSMLAPQGTPSVQDADLAPQSQAFAAAVNARALKSRAEAVHQASRGGYANSGGMDQRLSLLDQQAGQAIGANDAALIGQKQDARRQELQFALQQAQTLGMADEANNLQRQLANLQAGVQTRGQDIDARGQDVQERLGRLDANTRMQLGNLNAQLQREGYSAQERLARMDSELKRYGIDMQGRLGDLDAALRNRQIDLGYDQLGVDVASRQAQMNRDAVIAGMGG